MSDQITIKDDYIKLGQAMKLSNLVSSGTDAKYLIQNGNVLVNGEVCLMRGKKLYPGDRITFENRTLEITRNA